MLYSLSLKLAILFTIVVKSKQGQGNQCQTLKVMRNSLQSPGKVLAKSWQSPGKVFGKVLRKFKFCDSFFSGGGSGLVRYNLVWYETCLFLSGESLCTNKGPIHNHLNIEPSQFCRTGRSGLNLEFGK